MTCNSDGSSILSPSSNSLWQESPYNGVHSQTCETERLLLPLCLSGETANTLVLETSGESFGGSTPSLGTNFRGTTCSRTTVRGKDPETSLCAGLTQRPEFRFYTAGVEGSNPSSSTNFALSVGEESRNRREVQVRLLGVYTVGVSVMAAHRPRILTGRVQTFLLRLGRMAMQRSFKPRGVGSIPTGATNFRKVTQR